MDANLAKILIQRGIIREGTTLDAYQSARSLSCVCDSYALIRYVVMRATASGEWVFFEVATSATERHRIRCDYVTGIDGMAVERVAAAHQLYMNGSPATMISRGRRKQKPINCLPMISDHASDSG